MKIINVVQGSSVHIRYMYLYFYIHIKKEIGANYVQDKLKKKKNETVSFCRNYDFL